MTRQRHKFILTVEVRSPDGLERVLLNIARRLGGRLTRSDWDEDEADGRLREVGRRTIYKPR